MSSEIFELLDEELYSVVPSCAVEADVSVNSNSISLMVSEILKEVVNDVTIRIFPFDYTLDQTSNEIPVTDAVAYLPKKNVASINNQDTTKQLVERGYYVNLPSNTEENFAKNKYVNSSMIMTMQAKKCRRVSQSFSPNVNDTCFIVNNEMNELLSVVEVMEKILRNVEFDCLPSLLLMSNNISCTSIPKKPDKGKDCCSQQARIDKVKVNHLISPTFPSTFCWTSLDFAGGHQLPSISFAAEMQVDSSPLISEEIQSSQASSLSNSSLTFNSCHTSFFSSQYEQQCLEFDMNFSTSNSIKEDEDFVSTPVDWSTSQCCKMLQHSAIASNNINPPFAETLSGLILSDGLAEISIVSHKSSKNKTGKISDSTFGITTDTASSQVSKSTIFESNIPKNLIEETLCNDKRHETMRQTEMKQITGSQDKLFTKAFGEHKICTASATSDKESASSSIQKFPFQLNILSTESGHNNIKQLVKKSDQNRYFLYGSFSKAQYKYVGKQTFSKVEKLQSFIKSGIVNLLKMQDHSLVSYKILKEPYDKSIRYYCFFSAISAGHLNLNITSNTDVKKKALIRALEAHSSKMNNSHIGQCEKPKIIQDLLSFQSFASSDHQAVHAVLSNFHVPVMKDEPSPRCNLQKDSDLCHSQKQPVEFKFNRFIAEEERSAKRKLESKQNDFHKQDSLSKISDNPRNFEITKVSYPEVKVSEQIVSLNLIGNEVLQLRLKEEEMVPKNKYFQLNDELICHQNEPSLSMAACNESIYDFSVQKSCMDVLKAPLSISECFPIRHVTKNEDQCAETLSQIKAGNHEQFKYAPKADLCNFHNCDNSNELKKDFRPQKASCKETAVSSALKECHSAESQHIEKKPSPREVCDEAVFIKIRVSNHFPTPRRDALESQNNECPSPNILDNNTVTAIARNISWLKFVNSSTPPISNPSKDLSKPDLKDEREKDKCLDIYYNSSPINYQSEEDLFSAVEEDAIVPEAKDSNGTNKSIESLSSIVPCGESVGSDIFNDSFFVDTPPIRECSHNVVCVSQENDNSRKMALQQPVVPSKDISAVQPALVNTSSGQLVMRCPQKEEEKILSRVVDWKPLAWKDDVFDKQESTNSVVFNGDKFNDMLDPLLDRPQKINEAITKSQNKNDTTFCHRSIASANGALQDDANNCSIVDIQRDEETHFSNQIPEKLNSQNITSLSCDLLKPCEAYCANPSGNNVVTSDNDEVMDNSFENNLILDSVKRESSHHTEEAMLVTTTTSLYCSEISNEPFYKTQENCKTTFYQAFGDIENFSSKSPSPKRAKINVDLVPCVPHIEASSQDLTNHSPPPDQEVPMSLQVMPHDFEPKLHSTNMYGNNLNLSKDMSISDEDSEGHGEELNDNGLINYDESYVIRRPMHPNPHFTNSVLSVNANRLYPIHPLKTCNAPRRVGLSRRKKVAALHPRRLPGHGC